MKRILHTLLLAIIVSATIVNVANAVGDDFDPEFYQANDILWYDPRAGSCSAATSTLAGNTNPEKIWNFLIGKGLTPAQASGIMGNIQQESGPNFDSGAAEKDPSPGGAGGFGIIQWTGSRRTQLFAAAAKQGVPVSDLAFQLEFLYQESNNRQAKPSWGGGNEWEGLKRQNTVHDAALYWHDNAERSADGQAGIEKRATNAQAWYDKFSGNTTGGGGTSSNCGGTADTSSLSSTVLSYAWPQYHAPNYTNAKPEYATAVAKAQKEGRYVGGGVNPGIDCGGFVTTVMYDSGFDKTYNSNAKGGATGEQQSWAEKNWQHLGSGSSINVADLKPGDVAFEPGHTFLYVGKIPGFGENDPKFKGVASASYEIWRAPMAGHESLTTSDVTWYRKK